MRFPRSIPGTRAAAVVSAVMLAGASLATAAATAAVRPAAGAARVMPGGAAPHGRLASAPVAAAPGGTAPQLHVSGSELVDSTGQRVVLHGVDRSGTEYMCVQGNGIFDGPHAVAYWAHHFERAHRGEGTWDYTWTLTSWRTGALAYDREERWCDAPTMQAAMREVHAALLNRPTH